MTASLENHLFPRELPDGGSLGEWAVFFDIDGTLLDIAETPEAVRIPDDLLSDLAQLSRKLGGALALVTGRSISFVDTIFPDARFAMAGLHGAERRDPTGHVTHPHLTTDFVKAKEELKKRAERWPQILVEDKQAAIAVHYRQSPHLADDMRRLMDEIAMIAGPGWTLQQGKQVVELRPAGRDKGRAVETFMAAPPFLTRRPLVFGDDVTDEAMFKAANALGGLSVGIGVAEERPSAATLYLQSPAILRAWLSKIAR